MTTIRSLALSLLALSLAACSSGGGSGSSAPLKPLTPEQKQSVSEVSQSVDLAQNTSQVNQQNMNIVAPAAFSTDNAMSKDEKAREMSKALQQGACQFTNNLPKNNDGNGPQNGEFALTVSGPDCPVSVTFKVTNKVVQNSNQITFGVTMSEDYVVRNTAFSQLNDVSAIHMHGALNYQGGPQGASGGGTLNGKVTTQKYGEITATMQTNMSANQTASSNVETTTLQFKDFTAVGKVVNIQKGQEPGTTTYTINDKSVDQKEFYDVFGNSFSSNGQTMANVN